MIRRTLRRMREDDSGLSLTELLVSGLLTVAIMAMIGTMFIQTAKITANSTQTSKSNNVAANIANEMTSAIRVATTVARSGATTPDPAILDGSRETLTIYALSNTDAAAPAPVRIKFTITPKPGTPALEPRAVMEERCTATSAGGFWTFGSCASLTTRSLGGQVTDLTGTIDQLFTYYTDTAGTHPILIGADSLTDAQRATVASIRVYVSIKATGSDTKQTVISNLVVLGNLGLEDL
jgi:Tfp pilus assembly protein PilW